MSEFILKFRSDITALTTEVDQKITKALTAILMDFTSQLQEESPHGATGKLQSQWNIHQRMRKTKTGLVGTIGTVEYGAYVESGTTGGKHVGLSYKALIDWAEIKLGLEGSEARRAAFFITKKIKAEGVKGQGYVQKVWDEHVPFYEKMLAK